MDFVTPGYYYWFLPVVVFLCLFMARRKRNIQILILLGMSYLFFFLASGWHILLLLTSTLVDWTAGKKIHQTEDKIRRKRWLQASLVINLSLLGIFKYLDFLIETWNLASLRFAWAPELDTYGLLLPVGISFYTFQTMSYTIDIYRGKSPPYERFRDFACYAAFFPQLVAGPIVRSQHFLKQIEKPISTNQYRFRLGLTLIIYGITKKLLVADNMAIHVNSIFVEGAALQNIGLIWWGSLCFGIQIYCDFSAYTDIAIGSGHLLGIELPENFKTPYAAKSPQEFWRRWHISLSTWLRDYLFIPLGGSRGGARVLVIALMGTMLLGGLWHGASWNFVLWGFLHGLLLLSHRGLIKQKLIKVAFEKMPKAMAVIGWATTQFAVFFTWLVFRVEDTDILIPSMKTFLGWGGHWNMEEMRAGLPDVQLLTFCLALVFIVIHGLSGHFGGGKKWLANQNALGRGR
jgi:alginate O-acetyltransferase complex protein AlgI